MDFSFVTILESHGWASLLDSVVNKLTDLLPVVNRDDWPATSEYFAAMSYDIVRSKKSKRIGARFVRVPKM